jgi:hypothetical protein
MNLSEIARVPLLPAVLIFAGVTALVIRLCLVLWLWAEK